MHEENKKCIQYISWKDGIGKTCSMTEKTRNAYNILVGKPQGKKISLET
jgi:hypothetical protein